MCTNEWEGGSARNAARRKVPCERAAAAVSPFWTALESALFIREPVGFSSSIAEICQKTQIKGQALKRGSKGLTWQPLGAKEGVVQC